MPRKYEGRRLTPTMARRMVVGLVVLAAAVGFIWHTGTGTLSSFGWRSVALLCPLGALEAMLGGWAFAPRALIALAAVVLVVLFTGRAFCAWVCPVPPLTRFFQTKKATQADEDACAKAGQVARHNYEAGVQVKHAPANIDSRHIVLCGALGTTAIFGFPVFCLVCPIGLTFAIMIGLVRLVGFNEPSFSLVLFAAILLVELVVLRKWCHKICPLGALLSLVSQANRTLRPAVDAGKCLRTAGCDSCGVCAAVCPEHIDPHSNVGLAPISECTRCGVCAEKCPEGAIGFPFFGKTADAAPGSSATGVSADPQTADAQLAQDI